jgi:hypothetical protein
VEFPGFDHVFIVETPASKRAYQGRFDPRDTELQIRELLLGLRQPMNEPVLIRHAQGEAVPGPCFWVSGIFGPIVSISIVELLQAHKITGWGTFPVRVLAKSGDEVQGYVGLRSTARPVSVIDYTKGRRIASRNNPNSFRYIGGEFDGGTWDGSDIFRSGNSNQLMVVERVRKVIEAAKISNVRFIALSEHDVLEYFALLLLRDAGYDVGDLSRFEMNRG